MVRETLKWVSDRLAAYDKAEVDYRIADVEDMFHKEATHSDALAHYRQVGQSAVDAIVRALVAAGAEARFEKVLDLPCGGGRVTRHLKVLFPEATIFVGDIDPKKVAAVTEQFGAEAIQAGGDFSIASAHTFDLIWVGSLFTHLSERHFSKAFEWFVDSLSPPPRPLDHDIAWTAARSDAGG